MILINTNLPENSFAALISCAERKFSGKFIKEPEITVNIDSSLPEGNYIISANGADVTLNCADIAACFASLGHYVELCEPKDGKYGEYTGNISFAPTKEVRGMYFATHFGNYYHKASYRELCEVIEDIATYGANALLVWFDMHHYDSIEDEEAKIHLARLRNIISYANVCGIAGGLTMLSNEGYASSPKELRSEFEVQNGYHTLPCGIYRVEICPSKEGGIEKILEYRRELYEKVKDLNIKYFSYWPYDQGGCTCEKCAPWGSNGFLKLLPYFYNLTKEYFPNSKFILSTWFFDKFIDGEWDAFAKRLRAGEFSHIDYIISFFFEGKLPEALKEGIPEGTKFIDFPEISMYTCNPWGGFGANPLPRFLYETDKNSGHIYSGGFPYSEGIYEDINKYITLACYSGLHKDAYEAVDGYCRRYFRCSDKALSDAIIKTETALARSRKERNSTYIKDTSDIDSVYETITRYDSILPEDVRKSREWRLIYIRAVLDHRTQVGGSKFSEDEVIQSLFTELINYYHAEADTYEILYPPRYDDILSRIKRAEFY